MNSKLFAVLWAAGTMIPVFGQNIILERTPGDGPVHPGEKVCITATMARPDDEVAGGYFTVQNKSDVGSYATSIGAVATRLSPSTLKLCGSLSADAPSGNYAVVGVDLWTSAGKRTNSTYPTDFHQLISFQFINEAKDVPIVTDVKRVPVQ